MVKNVHSLKQIVNPKEAYNKIKNSAFQQRVYKISDYKTFIFLHRPAK